MKEEKIWIQKRRIPTGQQGKNAKMICMLEDEGTMIAVRECITTAGTSIYSTSKVLILYIKILILKKDLTAHTIAAAVTDNWKSTYPDINQIQQIQRFSASLEEIQY